MVKFSSLLKAVEKKCQNYVFPLAFPRTWSWGHQRSYISMKVKLRFYLWYMSHIKNDVLDLSFSRKCFSGSQKRNQRSKITEKRSKNVKFQSEWKVVILDIKIRLLISIILTSWLKCQSGSFRVKVSKKIINFNEKK